MNYKVFALGTLIGLAVAVAPSCSPDPACSAANCNGCCSADGKECIEAVSQNATQCGASGAECKACAATESCVSGICQASGGGNNDAGGGGNNDGGTSCNATTCPNGCCAQGGTICLQGKSTTNCGSGGAACAPCGASQTCNAVSNGGQCTTVAPPDAGSIGNACTMNSECADLGPDGTCRTQTSSGNATYPGGYCTLECGNAMCPTGSVCLGTSSFGENPICTKSCGAGNPCRTPGYRCYQLQNGGGACWLDPLPEVDAGNPAPDNLVGSACAMDSDCNVAGQFDKGTCFPATEADGGATGWTDGYCVADCSLGAICGTTAECFTLTAGGQQFSTCLDLCTGPTTGQGDCRTGYVCDSYNVGLPDGGVEPAPDGVCWPSCAAAGWGCPQGTTCNMLGYCE